MALLGTVLGRLLTAAGLYRCRKGRGRRGGVRARKEARATAVTSALCVFLGISFASSTEAAVIFVNGKDIVHKGSGGTSFVFPDVTITPCVPSCGFSPIPFPNIGESSDGTTTHQSKIPVTKTRDEDVKLAVPYDVFFGDEAGTLSVSLADSSTGVFFEDYSFVLTETSTGVFFFDLTELPVDDFDIVVELRLAGDGSAPETRLLIPFIEGVGVSAVPEPSALVLITSGLLGLSGYRAGAGRRRRPTVHRPRLPQV
jgi:hypothetical protein